jgi:hypothetical protein
MRGTDVSKKKPGNAVGRNSSTTLCWGCARACRGTALRVGMVECCWVRNKEPVKGWDAVYNPIKITHTNIKHGQTYVTEHDADSYNVIRCPLYVPDPKRSVV